jgi:hypothetical protein
LTTIFFDSIAVREAKKDWALRKSIIVSSCAANRELRVIAA